MKATEVGGRSEPVRVARVISRLNVGGPAIQAITLTKLLEPLGYETLLIRGSEADHEGSMDHLAAELGVKPRLIARMGRELGPGDLLAFVRLVGELRRFRPDVVHTHAAKAGTLGRLAALVPGRGRPKVIVHTFHGHSLTGYFSPWRAAVFVRIERLLARHTTRLIAVSTEVRDDLVRLGVADAGSIDVIRLGFDLDRFQVDESTRQRRRDEIRAELGIPPEARVVTLIARLVPIKRVDRFLRIAEDLAQVGDIWFLIVGDGELRDELRRVSVAAGLDGRVVWAGFQRDIPAVCFASDVVVLTSDNEGTPVSLIEAQAAGVPVVSTRVGGAASVMPAGSARLVAPGDEAGFARVVEGILAGAGNADSNRGAETDREAGRRHVTATFALPRLVDDLDALYRRLLARPR